MVVMGLTQKGHTVNILQSRQPWCYSVAYLQSGQPRFGIWRTNVGNSFKFLTTIYSNIPFDHRENRREREMDKGVLRI